MIIHFYTCAYPLQQANKNIYSDLTEAFARLGHEVRVFCPDESRAIGTPTEHPHGRVRIFTIPTGRIQKTNPIAKLINTYRFARKLATTALRQASAEPPSLIISCTPPVDLVTAVAKVKASTGAATYLLLKDIFPANAADLGMISRSGLAWQHFRQKEKALYAVSDYIGCMSPANKVYLEAHNPELDPNRIEVCPNSIQPTLESELLPRDKAALARLYIPTVRLNLLYGGNLGVPQGIEFLIETLRATQGDSEVHVTIVGDGTQFGRLEAFKSQSGHPFTLLRRIPRQDYLTLLRSMDAGLIFLDRRFTIPNFPSRLLDYLDSGLPVLAATDRNTDIGTFLMQEQCGLWSEAGDLPSFLANVEALKNEAFRLQMGRSARSALETHFTVQRSADIILRHLEE